MDHATIARLAERQHGVVLRRQLTAAGLAPDGVDAMVRRGRLRRVAHGTYAVGGSPSTLQQETMTAVLRCGPDALAVGERMLAFTGLREAGLDASVTVLLRPGRRVRNVPWRTRQDRWAETTRRVDVDGIPSVDRARNLLEAAVDASDDDLERLVDGVRWAGRLPFDRLCSTVAAFPDHPGAIVLRRSGLVYPAAGESPPERDLGDLVAHHDPRRQVWVLPDVRVDLLIPAANLVIEYDGWATHDSASGRRRRADRDAALRAAGYVVIHVTDKDLHDAPALVTRIDGLVALLAS